MSQVPRSRLSASRAGMGWLAGLHCPWTLRAMRAQRAWPSLGPFDRVPTTGAPRTCLRTSVCSKVLVYCQYAHGPSCRLTRVDMWRASTGWAEVRLHVAGGCPSRTACALGTAPQMICPGILHRQQWTPWAALKAPPTTDSMLQVTEHSGRLVPIA